jgi:hypothetical protein
VGLHLESARELKQEIVGELLEALSADARELSNFGLEASRASVVGPYLDTVGLGVSLNGGAGYRLAIRIQRRGLQRHHVVDDIRRRASDEVDLRYIGHVSKFQRPQLRGRSRPLRIGNSIGHYEVTAGSLGGFVGPPGGAPALLSNNHVLAGENRGDLGDAILQPAVFDGGTIDSDRVAALSKFVPLEIERVNTVDCALAQIDDGVEFDESTLVDDVRLTGVIDVLEAGSVEVEKLGRTTGRTTGRISAFEIDNLTVGYDLGMLRFDDQIEVESLGTGPFSLGGDSGSLVYTSEDGNAFGLLFAGSDQGGRNGLGVTYVNPLTTVLSALDAELLT